MNTFNDIKLFLKELLIENWGDDLEVSKFQNECQAGFLEEEIRRILHQN